MICKYRIRSSILLALVVLIAIVSLAWIIYGAYGHKVVTDIYNGESYSFLNSIMGSQDIHALDFYLEKADILFIKLILFVVYLCFCVAVLCSIRNIELRINTLIFFFAVAVVVNSQFLSYLTPYVINDDVRQHTWWMRQFRDKQLFNGDLLALYARNIQPWGFLALYYPISFVMDPIVAGKVLPPVLMGAAAVYFYKIIRYLTKDITSAVIGGVIFSITPVFLRQTVGAHARGFAFPLMIMFLFYLIKKEYPKSCMLIVLQSLFYPVTAVLSGITYLFSFIGFRNAGLFVDASRKKVIYFVLAFVFSASILFGKQFFTYDAQVGSPVSRNEVIDKIEFYNERWPLLPTPLMSQELAKNLEKGVFLFRSWRKTAAIKFIQSTLQYRKVFLILALLLMAGLAMFRKVIPVPKEIYYLLISGTIMYKMADIFFLKLYSPRRYLEYSAPLVSVFIFVFFVTGIVSLVRKSVRRRIVQACICILVLLNFNISSNEALIDMSGDKGLYEFLSSIPKDALVGAHPDLADGVPTFSRRKVFVAKDLSVPLFDNYWGTVKKRTFELFAAYYSDDPEAVYNFCVKNNIDYLVVDKRHFDSTYISDGVYFEPFNSFVAEITENRTDFALEKIPDEDQVYNEGDIFVVETKALRDLGSVSIKDW